jgi:hypothetical protein
MRFACPVQGLDASRRKQVRQCKNVFHISQRCGEVTKTEITFRTVQSQKVRSSIEVESSGVSKCGRKKTAGLEMLAAQRSVCFDQRWRVWGVICVKVSHPLGVGQEVTVRVWESNVRGRINHDERMGVVPEGSSHDSRFANGNDESNREQHIEICD